MVMLLKMGQLISVMQLLLVLSSMVNCFYFSVVPVLICEIAVITVFTVKTFEKTRLAASFVHNPESLTAFSSFNCLMTID